MGVINQTMTIPPRPQAASSEYCGTRSLPSAGVVGKPGLQCGAHPARHHLFLSSGEPVRKRLKRVHLAVEYDAEFLVERITLNLPLVPERHRGDEQVSRRRAWWQVLGE